MKTLIPTVVALIFLSGCGQIADIGKSRVERTREVYGDCRQSVISSIPMFEAASSQAISPTYATEARANAETCADARRKLAVIDPDHECLPIATMAEGIHWALAASFEGKREIDSYTPTTVTSEETIACLVASGVTPEEVAVARREEAERQRLYAAQDAMRAAQ